jgi:hypothetical protein
VLGTRHSYDFFPNETLGSMAICAKIAT